jgi:prepilin-type N-terminal cleavage/methylation domain-containing protein
MKTNQKGFSVVEILIVLVVIGLLGTVGWLVYDRQNNKKTENPATESSTQQNNETSKQESSTQQVEKTDPNEGYLVLKEWGLRFKIPSGLADVKYTIHDDTVSFFAKPTGSSVQYRTDYDKFVDGHSQYAIGNLFRSTSSTKPYPGEDSGRQGKKVGDYYYYTSWAFSSLASGAGCVGLYGEGESNCNVEIKVFDLMNVGNSALLNTIELSQ